MDEGTDCMREGLSVCVCERERGVVLIRHSVEKKLPFTYDDIHTYMYVYRIIIKPKHMQISVLASH